MSILISGASNSININGVSVPTTTYSKELVGLKQNA